MRFPAKERFDSIVVFPDFYMPAINKSSCNQLCLERFYFSATNGIDIINYIPGNAGCRNVIAPSIVTAPEKEKQKMGVSENNDIVLHTGGGGYELATAHEIRRNVNLIQEVIKSVFKEGTHFGIIPGCKQKSLYKAGAEKILATFRIAVDPEVEDLSTPDEVRYRVRVKGFTPDGRLVGVGIGECSSSEEKYAWRAAVSDAEFKATDELRRRVKYYKNGGTVNQVRTNPADVANTVLKMSKKRGQNDLCLTATAASDVFTQDIEDLPPEYVEGMVENAPQPPKPKAPAQDEMGQVVGEIEEIRAVNDKVSKIFVAGIGYATGQADKVAKAKDAMDEKARVKIGWVKRKGVIFADSLEVVGDQEDIIP
jgi:hypothetical protein